MTTLMLSVPAFMLAAESAESIPTYSVMGLTLAVLLFLMRRWAKQRDDAIVAAQEAEARERTRAALELDKVKAEHRAELDYVKTEMARMRSVLSRVLTALMDDTMTHDDKAALRIESMRVLFPPSEQQP